ncbi:zinc finger BED domain-containing protein RICESLEEPER 1-like [Canna indica]|uniref:Zinc finger BED domain-containing protein RICESLEEPER 1-like n=1 Tax=Canna indica TaxID=4628 RepID=A0AAQ3QIB0_9LILI|nr:zinc finger BED domain-containing protein RICESLEEPER 1-like [Canna indica]
MSLSDDSFDLEKFRELFTFAFVMHNLPFQYVEYEGVRACFQYLLSSVQCIFKNTAKIDVLKLYELQKKKIKSMLAMTSVLFSGTKYPTTNLFLTKVFLIYMNLKKACPNDDDSMRRICTRMKVKLEKYWISFNEALTIAVVLDPRYKLEFVEFAYEKLLLMENSTAQVRHMMLDPVGNASSARRFPPVAIRESSFVVALSCVFYCSLIASLDGPSGATRSASLWREVEMQRMGCVVARREAVVEIECSGVEAWRGGWRPEVLRREGIGDEMRRVWGFGNEDES